MHFLKGPLKYLCFSYSFLDGVTLVKGKLERMAQVCRLEEH